MDNLHKYVCRAICPTLLTSSTFSLWLKCGQFKSLSFVGDRRFLPELVELAPFPYFCWRSVHFVIQIRGVIFLSTFLNVSRISISTVSFSYGYIHPGIHVSEEIIWLLWLDLNITFGICSLLSLIKMILLQEKYTWDLVVSSMLHMLQPHAKLSNHANSVCGYVFHKHSRLVIDIWIRFAVTEVAMNMCSGIQLLWKIYKQMKLGKLLKMLVKPWKNS